MNIDRNLMSVRAVLMKVEPSGEFPVHKDAFHHIFYFLEGTGELWLANETLEIKEGLIVEVPSGVKHGYKNTGKDDLLLITLKILS